MSEVPLVVRVAEPSDLAELLVMVAEYCEADGHEFDERVATAGLVPLLGGDNDRHGLVVIADESGTAVGYAVLAWGWSVECGGREAVLDELFVRSRGRGIGSELLRAAEATCRAHGVLRVFLETEAPNESARRLYTRHGFTEETSIWMSKHLTRRPDARGLSDAGVDGQLGRADGAELNE